MSSLLTQLVLTIIIGGATIAIAKLKFNFWRIVGYGVLGQLAFGAIIVGGGWIGLLLNNQVTVDQLPTTGWTYILLALGCIWAFPFAVHQDKLRQAGPIKIEKDQKNDFSTPAQRRNVEEGDAITDTRWKCPQCLNINIGDKCLSCGMKHQKISLPEEIIKPEEVNKPEETRKPKVYTSTYDEKENLRRINEQMVRGFSEKKLLLGFIIIVICVIVLISILFN
jgi:hypothetical protein